MLEVVLDENFSASDGALYDAFVDGAASGHYSQTRAWAPVTRAAKPVQSTYFLAKDAGTVVAAAQIVRPRIGPVLAPVAIIERGPIANDPKNLEQILPVLVRALRRRGVVRISVMPYFAGAEKTSSNPRFGLAAFAMLNEPMARTCERCGSTCAKKNGRPFLGRRPRVAPPKAETG